MSVSSTAAVAEKTSRKRPRHSVPAAEADESEKSSHPLSVPPTGSGGSEDTQAQSKGADGSAEQKNSNKPATVVTTAKSGRELNKKLWAKDPIYRIVRQLPRSDVVHFVKCKLKEKDCLRAVQYMKETITTSEGKQAQGYGGMRDLRLQWGVSLEGGLEHILPLLSAHRYTLRKVDLSRNRLTPSDVSTIGEALDLANSSGQSNLELLDLSYNPGLGDKGAVAAMQALQGNVVIKAVQLKHVGITDAGCLELATYLCHRSLPQLLSAAMAEPTFGGQTSVSESATFFLNLNENRIGSRGLRCFQHGAQLVPHFVSLSLVQQRVLPTRREEEQ